MGRALERGGFMGYSVSWGGRKVNAIVRKKGYQGRHKLGGGRGRPVRGGILHFRLSLIFTLNLIFIVVVKYW